MKTSALSFLLAASLLVGGLTGSAALARDYAVVDSVQMPAWVERNGVRQPLAPGEVLRNRDRVSTGADARVVIALVEGSAVRLGENAQLDINALGRRESKVFTASLDVARGAFRFTSGVFSGPRGSRAVNVRIATITAGVRGTDLWGKADDERDLICLLDGRISVFHAQGEAREMSEAGSVYVAAKGAAPEPLTVVAPQQVAAWALQTEIGSGTGYSRRGGRWLVELASVDGESAALALYDQARAAGYAARIKPRRAAAGAYLYSVRVTQLPSAAEAYVLAEKLTRALALSSPVVTR